MSPRKNGKDPARSESEPLLQPAPASTYRSFPAEPDAVEPGPDAVSASTSYTDRTVRIVVNVLLALCVALAFAILMVKLVRFEDLQKEVLTPHSVQVDSIELAGFTSKGPAVRVVGTLTMDYSLVSGPLRHWFLTLCSAVIGTVMAAAPVVKISVDQGTGEVQEYQSVMDATLPALQVDIRDRHLTSFDFVTTLSHFGSALVLESIANRILAQDPLPFRVQTNLTLGKAGFWVGTFPVTVEQVVRLSSSDLDLNDTSVTISGVSVAGSESVIMTTQVLAHHPPVPRGFAADLPELLWSVSVEGCDPGNYIYVTDSATSAVSLEAGNDTSALQIWTEVAEVAPELQRVCANTTKSPLDRAVAAVLGQEPVLVRIQGAPTQSNAVPEWMADLIRQVSVVMPVQGQDSASHIIKELQFEDFTFMSLQGGSLMAPEMSTMVTIVVQPPDYVDLDQSLALDITHTRGIARVSHQEGEFAEIDFPDWIACETTRDDEDETYGRVYRIKFFLDNVPLNVTDKLVFAEVMQDILFFGKSQVNVAAVVDTQAHTPIGNVTLAGVEAGGNATLKAH